MNFDDDQSFNDLRIEALIEKNQELELSRDDYKRLYESAATAEIDDLFSQIETLSAINAGLEQALSDERRERNEAICERNELAVLLAQVWAQTGLTAGIMENRSTNRCEYPWIVYVGLPTGPATWPVRNPPNDLPKLTYRQPSSPLETRERVRLASRMVCSN